MQFKALVILSFILLLSSCGYQFQGSGSVLPDDIKTVAIPVVRNNTTESGLGLELTERLRSRFERYGVVTVIDDAKSADALLDAEILNVQTRVQDVTGETDIELEQELIIYISAELRRKNGQILWKNESLAARETFASTSDVVVTSSSSFTQSGIGSSQLGSLGSREVSRGQKKQALDDLLDEASRAIYEDSVAADF